MFSYPPISTIALGPLTVHVWGVFVGLGILAATWVAVRRGRRAGIASQRLWDLAFWVVLAGIVGARALYVAEYWRDFMGEPWRVIAIWEGGMSVFGSLLAAVPVAWWWTRRRRLSFRQLAEVVAPSLLLGDAIGRLGGAASHMYQGRPTTFPISYVLDGIQRHEVGIELALASFAGFLAIVGLEYFARQKLQVPSTKLQTSTNDQMTKTSRRFGFWNFGFVWNLEFGTWSFSVPLTLLWYSLERFLLDFLRAADLPESDVRYGGLTLAQYFAIAGLFLGLVFLTRFLARRA